MEGRGEGRGEGRENVVEGVMAGEDRDRQMEGLEFHRRHVSGIRREFGAMQQRSNDSSSMTILPWTDSLSID
jgi:hypothetical protein